MGASPWPPQSSSVPLSLLTGRFPALAGIDLVSPRARSLFWRGPTGPARRRVLRACAGLLPVTAARPWCSGHDLRRHRTAVRRQVGMLGHAAAPVRRLDVHRERPFRRPGRRRRRLDGIDGALERLGSGGPLAAHGRRPAVGRPAPPGGPGRPRGPPSGAVAARRTPCRPRRRCPAAARTRSSSKRSPAGPPCAGLPRARGRRSRWPTVSCRWPAWPGAVANVRRRRRPSLPGRRAGSP